MGGEAPALIDIAIERASDRFEPRLVAEFSNGHRTSVPVSATDFYAFCERHSTWDLDSLRSALLSEGGEIYAHLLEGQANLGARDQYGQPVAQAETSPTDTRRRLREWWNRQWPRSPSPPTSYRDAQARGMRLLDEKLSPTQRTQYRECGYFDVVGGKTGKRYRIRYGSQMNIEELDKKGRRVKLLCFMPEGGLVDGDVMLAQKFALELFEPQALKIANTFPNHYSLTLVPRRRPQWG